MRSTYSNRKSLALLLSSCSGSLYSNLPRPGTTSLLKSLASGKIFRSTVEIFSETHQWHYPRTDSTYTTAEGKGNWCYIQGNCNSVLARASVPQHNGFIGH